MGKRNKHTKSYSNPFFNKPLKNNDLPENNADINGINAFMNNTDIQPSASMVENSSVEEDVIVAQTESDFSEEQLSEFLNDDLDIDSILQTPTSEFFNFHNVYRRQMDTDDTEDALRENINIDEALPVFQKPAVHSENTVRNTMPITKTEEIKPEMNVEATTRSPFKKDANAVPEIRFQRPGSTNNVVADFAAQTVKTDVNQYDSEKSVTNPAVTPSYTMPAVERTNIYRKIEVPTYTESTSTTVSTSHTAGRRRRSTVSQTQDANLVQQKQNISLPHSSAIASEQAQNTYIHPTKKASAFAMREQEWKTSLNNTINSSNEGYIPSIKAKQHRNNSMQVPIIKIASIVGGVLVALLLIVLLVYILVPSTNTGFLGKIKSGIESIIPKSKEVSVENFSANSETNGFVGDIFTFSLTTKNNVQNVRLADMDNQVLNTVVYTTTNNDVVIWTINYTADNAFKGSVRPQLLNINNEWIDTENTISLNIANLPEETAALKVDEEPENNNEFEDVESTEEGLATEFERTPIPSAEPTVTPTMEPTPTPSPTSTPTPSPSPTPTPSATPEPTATPVPTPTPFLVGEVIPAKGKSAKEMGIINTSYKAGKSVSSFSRTAQINMPEGANYNLWEDAIFAFRSDAYRQNASVGAPKDTITNEKLTKAWSFPVGGMQLKSETVYGFGYMSQPAIVKWFSEARNYMNLKEDKKDVKALTEIIYAAQDGNIYFLDIKDGTETREKLKVGVPMKSAVSVYPGTVPVMGVGQSASFLKNKQVDIGYRIFSLLDYKQLHFIDGRDKRAYFTNGAFDGSAIFDRNSDTMLVAGENGLLYTVYLNSNFKHEEKSLSISPSVDSHKSIAKGQNKKLVGKESSVAMLGNYAFVADAAGLLQCIDVNLMQTVWASKLEDNIDATIAVDTTDDGKAYLYVANTIQNVKNRDSITVYKIDALSGEKIWSKNFGVEKDNKIITGALASPVIGKGVLEDYVYFTIADSKESAITVALSKEDGGQVWKKRLNAYAISSPIAIYQDQSAWIVQGDSAGNLYLLNALDGEEKDVLKLDGAIESSPAAYKGNIVVGTTGGKSNSLIYCITIQ